MRIASPPKHAVKNYYVRHTVILGSVLLLLVTGNVIPSSPSLVTLMIQAIHSSEASVLTREHGVTSQKTVFFNYLLSVKFLKCLTM
jgi:hypothetical protein